MKITETELDAARHYLQQQLETHSWWPKEQPVEARHEFTLMLAGLKNRGKSVKKYGAE